MTSLIEPRAAEPLPLAPDAPLPHRKVIRSWLIPLAQRTTLRALLLLAFDYALLLSLLSATVLLAPAWAKLLCGLAAGFVIGRLFIIGHDGCHQSLTPHRRLNKWLGRIAFLPSLTAYSLWDVGHNVVHHGFTNLKGVDFVWAPLTPDEYQALSPLRRAMERVYRSGWAPGVYYMVEIWWRRMFFPSQSSMGTQRPIFTWDCVLVSGYGLLWLAALTAAALSTGQSVLLVLVSGFVVPLLFWFAMIGFVVYVHHTHVKVSWHAERNAWARAQPFVSTTVHLTFPFQIGALLHHIMEHTAHHVDMSIPLYRLKEAQKKLEDLLPERIIIQPFSWRWYFDTARSCKLYDFSRSCWTDFAGRATSTPKPQAA
ncbi:omega-6 fatty acid desaturase (delta-12 desaturase) [Rhodoferax ferrireducens]|uniref:Omega-6 fatty acid desaturase (Delta-12 desaturase) n=1 Tax=Rhodoferax ferrireducens TaxID=192843 RepID=A0ABU2CB75_9BURK|nr:fatty acid desaturase [Rhodoferax ferrireducens]MDR7378570.1 omega-6 fatty acid desaturase (delta-12 desaturase) [Rhodoferax ferrireducens]